MRNKEQTKRKLIDTVRLIFQKEGYAGLGLNKIARIAGVDKKLIYRYFGNLDGLIEAYVMDTDYWMRFADGVRELSVPAEVQDLKKLLGAILKNQFLYFYEDQEMQQLILWELSAKSDLMRSIHHTREEMGKSLLELTDPHFKNKAVNFRAIAALLVGGIYYTILHTRHNGGMFSDVDLSTPEGRQEIIKAIDQVLDLTFSI
ncbi:TetR/AcrR family transcriptional regulator [Mucilaginibacter terrae]|uniref:AcrR family transcriptional regulator n=1 Tax=Mucilaginibacter terrae TaxID=1955052 RepID=A0ABU3GRC2_9SPHI|nr:TetR/AcrR family transcriptional regulator [Mucilaginibacter terrae]MDT3402330.1 AcrR family transcriptional regulator [Mucilaginibacter terrae]